MWSEILGVERVGVHDNFFIPEDDTPSVQHRTLQQWLTIVPGTAEIHYAPDDHFTLIRGDEGARVVGQWLSAELASRRRA